MQQVGEHHRMAFAVEAVHPPARPRTRPSGRRSRRWPGCCRSCRASVELEILMMVAQLRMGFERLRHACDVVDHGADRIARVGRRERPVQHVDAGDLLRRHQAPARRERGAIAEQVRQQDAVGIDQRTRAVAGARGAGGQYRVVEVADVALAHQQAREVLQHVLGVDRVDRRFRLVAGDALHRGRDLRRQRGRAHAGDGDRAEGACRLCVLLAAVGLRLRVVAGRVFCRVRRVGAGRNGRQGQGKREEEWGVAHGATGP